MVSKLDALQRELNRPFAHNRSKSILFMQFIAFTVLDFIPTGLKIGTALFSLINSTT